MKKEMKKKEKTIKKKKRPPLNPTLVLIDRYYQLQEHRIALGGQIWQLAGTKKIKMEKKKSLETNLNAMSDKDKMKLMPFLSYYENFHRMEKDIVKYIEKETENHIMYEWLMNIKGIGPIFAAGLLSHINIRVADHASSVWRYSGLVPGQKRVAGEKLDYSPSMKTLCWKIGESFVKSKGKYREIYNSSREFYDRKFPTKVLGGEKVVKGKKIKWYKYTDGHKYAMAKRRTVKLFLSDMWLEWRVMENLPISVPYAHRGLPVSTDISIIKKKRYTKNINSNIEKNVLQEQTKKSRVSKRISKKKSSKKTL